MQPISLYLHVPFCIHRCGYCDFNTYAGLEALMPAYVDALTREARLLAAAAGERLTVHTVFFGGGTPSLLPVDAIRSMLEAIRTAYDLIEDAEICLEANPGTVSLDKLAGLRQAGINRLSFGVQSASPEELRLLERQHDFSDVLMAVMWARQAGFQNLNLDWIFGLPGQSLASWARNLDLAIGLAPQHLSLYALSVEHGTPFMDLSSRGLLPDLDPDLAADMYELAEAKLKAAGFIQYEISNWAQPGEDSRPLACRHNLQYWRNLPYAGLGAGAHGFLAGQRTANVLAPAAYIKRLTGGKQSAFPRTPATVSGEPIDRVREMGETMMMGLRLVEEGVSRDDFSKRFGVSIEEVYGEHISNLSALGLLEQLNADRNLIRLTQRGKLLGNRVFREFV
ncbi:MAG: radical SAM family heme chaperone HemW [Anaerolineales bacterium]